MHMSAVRLSYLAAAGLMLSARQTGGIDRLPHNRHVVSECG